MKSYAVIDRFEGAFAVCEVELLEVEESNSENYFEHPTYMMDVPMLLIEVPTQESDVLVVEHDGEDVILVYNKSEEEKLRRIRVFKKMMNS